ncbi:MAG: Asp-tRNA(Asn)/Glu-tRNA(Gln) amidotransferase subunit GatC [Acidaminococcaceae bacterium]|jgi:aspartyl-tRNA(Asn)/glutamyl-tRNA(Gln) amidotransferase subunit C|nr:Asp-tRNA(Asn)/Glu-tRNA(Gln) amidotransferase subunit GatC [Acidaminococcaceae bacterium]MCI2109814.1 Asp-tRNA(Asn)/Glu-tRNA(Gln) amidotransferase subunit GatC [Acidaminococcaceae bacterium]
MKVTAKDVKHIANLSRLTVSDSEMDKFLEQFNQILNYADILQKVDTTGIEPSPYVIPLNNVLREDVAVPGVSHEEALKNAPEVHNGGFKVPRVIE